MISMITAERLTRAMMITKHLWVKDEQQAPNLWQEAKFSAEDQLHGRGWSSL